MLLLIFPFVVLIFILLLDLLSPTFPIFWFMEVPLFQIFLMERLSLKEKDRRTLKIRVRQSIRDWTDQFTTGSCMYYLNRFWFDLIEINTCSVNLRQILVRKSSSLE